MCPIIWSLSLKQLLIIKVFFISCRDQIDAVMRRTNKRTLARGISKPDTISCYHSPDRISCCHSLFRKHLIRSPVIILLLENSWNQTFLVQILCKNFWENKFDQRNINEWFQRFDQKYQLIVVRSGLVAGITMLEEIESWGISSSN